MSTLKIIGDFYNELDQEFNELYFEVLKDFNVNAIHDIRVNIKKHNAFFHLLESIDPQFESSESKAVFYKIFKNTGAIRKVHIEQKLLAGERLKDIAKEKLSSQLLKNLEKTIDKFLYHNNTRSLLAIRKLSPEIKNHILQLPEKNLLKNLSKYFRKLIENLKQLADASKRTKKAYHDLRKLLKELFYNLLLIKKLFPDKNLNEQIYTYLEQLQSNLGDWHDLYLTIKMLKKQKKVQKKIILLLQEDIDNYVIKIKSHLESFDDFSTQISEEFTMLFGE